MSNSIEKTTAPVSISNLLTLSEMAYLDFDVRYAIGAKINGRGDIDFSPMKLRELQINSELRDRLEGKSATEQAKITRDYHQKGQTWQNNWEKELIQMDDWVISGVINDNGFEEDLLTKENKKSGFFGVSFYNKITHELVVSFRGTEPDKDRKWDLTVVDLSMPLNASAFQAQWKLGTELINKSVAYVSQAFCQSASKLILTGHSLGGAIAEQIMNNANDNRNLFGQLNSKMQAVTFNAPGIRPFNEKYKAGSEAGKRVLNFIIENDVVGNIPGHYGNNVYVRSDKRASYNSQNPKHRTDFEIRGTFDKYIKGELIRKPIGLETEYETLSSIDNSDVNIVHGLEHFKSELSRMQLAYNRYKLNPSWKYITMYGTREQELRVNQSLQNNKTCKSNNDPLVLDLDGDGIETLSSQNGVYFDTDQNSSLEKVGWIKGDDGLLVLDKNADGKISSGNELFGDQTIMKNGQKSSNGFQALGDYDTNSDGKIDAADSIYSTLQVWKDTNGNGIVDAGELHNLSELGIRSIGLNAQVVDQTLEGGNKKAKSAFVTKTDGTTLEVGEIILAADPMAAILDAGTIVGGSEGNTYTLSKTSGQLHIYDHDETGAGIDKLIMADDVFPNEVVFVKSGSNLIVHTGSLEHSATFIDYFKVKIDAWTIKTFV